MNEQNYYAELCLRLYNAGNFREALAAAREWHAREPSQVAALNIAAGCAKQLGDHSAAEMAWWQVLDIAPSFADARYNLGVLYLEQSRLQEAEQACRGALQYQPGMGEAWRNLGIVLNRLGRHEEAEAACHQAIKLQPHDAEDHFNLGTLLAEQGRSQEAESAYRACLQRQPNHIGALNNLGILLHGMRQHARAADVFRQAIAIDSQQPELPNNLGSVLLELGEYAEAEASYRHALELKPDYAEAAGNLGNALRMQQRHAAAATAYRLALQLAPGAIQSMSQLIRVKRYAVAWPGLETDDAAVKHWLTRNEPGAVSPFALLVVPSLTGEEHRSASRLWAEHTFRRELALPPRVATAGGRQHERLRIGYLSADFHEHATAYLLSGVLDEHDKQRVEVYGYSYGPPRDDAARRRIKSACSVFRDLRELDDEAAASMIAADEIDILVDLKGYTQDCRIGIQARRPAPVVVSWLGYPGSLGHPRLADYIIGDPIVTPLAAAHHFSETIAQLPDCYQPNDGQRVIGATPGRAAAGLPEQGFVYCSFNLTAKINPEVFDVWCRLLVAVPGSYLWLLAGTEESMANLRHEAAVRGIGAERLVFAPKLPLPEHLGRLQLADLALDTYPYGSHTTGSDALWAGVPLVTCIGETFASRVAASLLHAVGLPELITTGWDDYFRLARDLALHPARLAELCKRLQDQRMTAPLFDTQRFTRNLEELYRRIWQNHLLQDSSPILMSTQTSRTAERLDPLVALLRPACPTQVVDIGANIDGTPPYQSLLDMDLCELVGFEPQLEALRQLQTTMDARRRFLPYCIGDGAKRTLNVCRASGMTSLLLPAVGALALFEAMQPLAEVLRTQEVETVRFDDVSEIERVDFLKINIQGGELAVFQHGRTKLTHAVAVQTAVAFIPLYHGQPVLGDIDLELRAQGFIPHCFTGIKKWPIAPCVINGDPRQPLNQLLEADLVYVRDLRYPELVSDEQLKHMALIAHHCYASYDLALRCIMLLEQREALVAGSQERYLEMIQVGKSLSTARLPRHVAQEAATLHVQGLDCLQQGDVPGAVNLLRKAIALDDSVAAYHANLAVALKGVGAQVERVMLYRRAIELAPDDPVNHANLAAALTDMGDFNAAEAEVRQALQLAPKRAESWLNLGGALAGQQRWIEAASAFDTAFRYQADLLAALLSAGKALRAGGDLVQAAARFRAARDLLLAQSPVKDIQSLGEIGRLFGEVLAESRDYAQAEVAFREALDCLPGDLALLTDLGNVLNAQGKLDEAISCYRRVVEVAPHLAGAQVNLGTVFQTLGHHAEAVTHFHKALALDPQSQAIYSNLGTSLTYSADHCPADLKCTYDDFDRIVAQPLRDRRPYTNDLNPDKRLRVGYVSPDFRKHAVAYFALPLLEGHHSDQVEVTCYYTHRQNDEWTDRFKAAVDRWVDCADIDHAALAERIRTDGIDILVDLAGHTEGSRLRTFARKPAPVQVTWMGYVTTTGLSAMDYRLTHIDADPLGVEADYAETLIRLPGTMWCYRPLDGMPDVAPAPFQEKGYVTFGAFNRFSKSSPRVLECWAQILAAVPDSRLLLCIPEGGVRDRVVDLFKRHGILPARLTLFSKVSHEQFWDLHGMVDIALDPFPFNGGTTSCETLWLGVPLITCTGGPRSFTPRFASRMGNTFLKAIGLPELITADEESYVACAIGLAHDPGRMLDLRQSLRIRMAKSVLTDEHRFVIEVEAAYRSMWQRWCDGNVSGAI